MGETPETPRRRLTGAIVPALAAAVLAALGALLIVGRGDHGGGAQVTENCRLDLGDEIGGPIDLVDSNGARVTQADFAGQPAVVYFGFTNCPDVCPTTMYTLAEALAQPGGYDVQPVLISVDPERDTPERIGEYVRTEGFPPGLVGLTGTRAQIDAAESAFHVYAERAPIEGAPEGQYNVDHSSFLYVMDGEWRTVAFIPTMLRARENDPRSPMVAVAPGELAACIAAGLEHAQTAS